MDERLTAVLSSYEGREHELIPILQHVQEEFGLLSEETMRGIARFTRVPESRVYAVSTFYAQFRFTPVGRYQVSVCRGTACHVRGAPRILALVEESLGIKEGECTPDGEFSIETVACIGACGLAPNVVINKQTYGHLTAKKVTEILSGLKSARQGAEHE